MNPFKCVICESDVQDPGHIGESNCPNCNSVFSYDEGMTLIKCGNLYTDDDYRRLVDESAKRIKELEQERDQYKALAGIKWKAGPPPETVDAEFLIDDGGILFVALLEKSGHWWCGAEPVSKEVRSATRHLPMTEIAKLATDEQRTNQPTPHQPPVNPDRLQQLPSDDRSERIHARE